MWTVWDPLERRRLLSAAFDLIGLTALRNDPAFTGIDGGGVSVVVIDTGLDATHPLLAPNFVAGFDAVSGANTATVVNPHGTHVAGIVGSRPDSSRGYDGGVAPRVGIIGINVFTSNSSGDVGATNSAGERALQWVLDHRAQYNIVAVNMSLGEGNYTSPSQVQGNVYVDEIDRLEDAGVTVVSSAGNSYGIIIDPTTGRQVNVQFPNSHAPGIVSTLDVGAVWQTDEGDDFFWGSGSVDVTTGPDRITSFSQRPPPEVGNAIFAPGAIITSTWPGNQLQRTQGTSQASPMVAGAVALLQDAALTFGGRLLSIDEVRIILQDTGDKILDGDDEDDAIFIDANNNRRIDSGEMRAMTNTGEQYSRLNIYRAVQFVKNMFGGSANPNDPNGTVAGAVIGPALNGTESSSIAGIIGTDGSKNVGAKDIDMYRFSVTSPGAATILLNRNSANPKDFNTYLRLFDAGGNQLAFDDNSAGSGFSRIDINLAEGVYYAGVSGAPNSSYNALTGGGAVNGATGNFLINFSLANVDPNGVVSGAVNVNLSDPSLGPQIFNGFIGTDFGNPVGVADVDLFKIVAPDDGKLMFDVDTPFTNDFVDTYLRVFDADLNLLGANDNSLATDTDGNATEFTDGFIDYEVGSNIAIGHSTDSFVIGDVNRGDVYYVGVSEVTNTSYDPRTLTGRTSGGDGGFYAVFITFANNDQNGVITQTSELSIPSGTISGTLGSDDAQAVGDRDVDLYAINPTSDGLLEINVDSFSQAGNANPVNTVLRIFEAGGKLLASSDDLNGPDPFLRISLPKNRWYYIGVSGFGNGSYDPKILGSGSPGDTGDYQLNLKMLSKSTVNSLWNDKIGAAAIKSVSFGTQINAALGMDDTGLVRGAKDVDLYKFVATSSGPIEIRARTLSSFGADTVLRAFNASGKELGSNDNSSSGTVDSRLQLKTKKGNTYYIGVSGAGKTPRAYDPVAGTGATSGSTGDYSLFVQGGYASVSSGKLTVKGTSGNDTITVTRAGSKYHVKRNSSTLSFSASSIKSLSITGGNGNDFIAIGSGIVSTTIDAGSGNDTVNGGDGNDTITGGTGKDRLSGKKGNDTLFARDTLRDLLDGGSGTDSAQVDGNDARDLIEKLLA